MICIEENALFHVWKTCLRIAHLIFTIPGRSTSVEYSQCSDWSTIYPETAGKDAVEMYAGSSRRLGRSSGYL